MTELTGKNEMTSRFRHGEDICLKPLPAPPWHHREFDKGHAKKPSVFIPYILPLKYKPYLSHYDRGLPHLRFSYVMIERERLEQDG
jgi:hypothetical protein